MIRAADKWMAGYVRSVLSRPRRVTGRRHLIFSMCDHFEPSRSGRKREAWPEAVQDWRDRYAAFGDFRDADGVPPQHTFFYPEEEYDTGCLAALADGTAAGMGEVEVHLHHRNDTADGLRLKLERFARSLRDDHGLLGEKRLALSNAGSSTPGVPAYAFIHGNWALCNSRPDGDWCGVNEELTVLANTGCYADFTFPSAPSPTQPRMVNCLYRARDTGQAAAADRGIEVGQKADREDALPHSPRPALLLITGPLALDWRRRKWGVLPRLENGEISGVNPPTPHRTDLWVNQSIHVPGRPAWIFVKIFTHGCVPANAATLLGPRMRAFHADLGRRFNDGENWRLHYVTAREQYNIVRAAEDGQPGEPGQYRNYEITPPPVKGQ